MTTLKELSNQFNLNIKENSPMAKINIGEYTFTDMDDSTPYIKKFTNKNNPNILLKINEDHDNILLFQRQPDNTVNATNWSLRTNKILHRKFGNAEEIFKNK